MNVGVFLCLEPYTSLENNLRLAHEYGFTHADITDKYVRLPIARVAPAMA